MRIPHEEAARLDALGSERLKARGDDVLFAARNAGACSSCGARIFWAKTAAGKPMPLNYEPREDGNVCLRDGAAHVLHKDEEALGHRYASHFATCPNASRHRKARP